MTVPQYQAEQCPVLTSQGLYADLTCPGMTVNQRGNTGMDTQGISAPWMALAVRGLFAGNQLAYPSGETCCPEAQSVQGNKVKSVGSWAPGKASVEESCAALPVVQHANAC